MSADCGKEPCKSFKMKEPNTSNCFYYLLFEAQFSLTHNQSEHWQLLVRVPPPSLGCVLSCAELSHTIGFPSTICIRTWRLFFVSPVAFGFFGWPKPWRDLFQKENQLFLGVSFDIQITKATLAPGHGWNMLELFKQKWTSAPSREHHPK